MIGREHLLRTDRPEVALLVHMDGQGSPGQKHATWRRCGPRVPTVCRWGGRTSTTRTHPTFTPRATMAKRPRPRMISYQ